MANQNDNTGLSETALTTPVVQLLELGAHFALAERAAKIGYWRQRLDERGQLWSPGLFAMLGIDPRVVQPSSQFLIDLIHPEDRAIVASEISAAIKGRKGFNYRTRTAKEDRIFDTHGDVECGADGRVTTLTGVIREVTAEVRDARKLKESEAAYRFMMDEATDIITRHQGDGVPVFVSPAVTRVLGHKPSEIIHLSPFDLCHPSDVASVESAIDDARRSGGTIAYTHRARHKDGHYVWLESRVRFARDPATGKLGSAISVTRDVTERKKFEDELAAERDRAEAANHTKSRFLANMSHELRTPLNAIIGFSDIMAREMFGPLGSERYGQYAKLVYESGGMLLDLINDLLDMSRIEAGKFELHYEEIDVGQAIEGCVAYSGEGGQSFHLKADSDSVRWRTGFR